jgi:hypothetical protein
LLVKRLVSEVSPAVNAQHREAAEPVLTGAAELVSIPVEALGAVVVVALAVTPVGEWAEAEAGVTAETPVEGLAGVEVPVAPQAVVVGAVAGLAEELAGTGAGPDGSAAAQDGAVVGRDVAAPDESAAAVGRVEFQVVQAGLAAEWVCSPAVLVWFAADRDGYRGEPVSFEVGLAEAVLA